MDSHQIKEINACDNVVDEEIHSKSMSFCSEDLSISGHEAKLEELMDEAKRENWRVDSTFQPNMDLNTLASFLNSEDDQWI